jgi:hypothetical protein
MSRRSHRNFDRIGLCRGDEWGSRVEEIKTPGDSATGNVRFTRTTASGSTRRPRAAGIEFLDSYAPPSAS